MLVLECAWEQGCVDYVALLDDVASRGRMLQVDGVWLGAWRKCGALFLVRGDRWDLVDIENSTILPDGFDALFNRVVHRMITSRALNGSELLIELQCDEAHFRIVEEKSVEGLEGHISFAAALDARDTSRAGRLPPYGVAHISALESPDAYVSHVEWGPPRHPIVLLEGAADARLAQALAWAANWASVAYVRHLDRPAEKLRLDQTTQSGGGEWVRNVIV